MDLEELKNFDVSDLSKLGSAPLPIRLVFLALAFVAVIGLSYYLHTSNQLAELDSLKAREAELKKELEKKHHKSANLEAYRAQLDEMEREFGAMLRQLPGKTEIPAVILDVSQTGLASGLQILLFKPQPEVNMGFYAEKPIKIKLRGKYDQMGRFASGIASLPRIATLDNIAISPERNSEALTMEVTAKTYRYLADDELASKKQNKNSKKKKGKQ
jgi:type IV pilus assembly protein PilO